MPQLTDQQRQALTTRDVSVALSAGAGCGKTFVLTERFLTALDPDQPGGPLRLDQLTAITFTERAAREMRKRIRAACTQRLLGAGEEQVGYWLGMVRDLDAARISTIHSFCGALLRSRAVEAGLDPSFQVLDTAQANTLLFELIDEQLRGRLAERDEAVMDLVVEYGLNSLRTMVEQFLKRRQEIDWAAWRSESVEGLLARWQDFWRCDVVPRVLGSLTESPAAKTVLEIAGRRPVTNATMIQRLVVLAERLPGLAECPDRDAALVAILDAARVQGGGTAKAWACEADYAAFKNAATELRESIKKLQGQLCYDAEAARPAATAALRVLAVAEDVARAYAARKQEAVALDFNDLLIAARDLLVGPEREEVRRVLAAQTRLLLVDEFQDTDPLQVELVKALCDGRYTDGRLFFVGDFKQSIYRFRGADPHVFRRLREEIPATGRLPLSLNFRSQPAILDFVNDLFSDAVGPEYEPLRPSRPQVSPRPAVEFLWAAEAEDADCAVADGENFADRAGEDESASACQRARRREADWIARRIRGLLDSGDKIVWDEAAASAGTPGTRALRPGDVAILFRALTDVAYYEEALRRYGLDHYLIGGKAFFAQQEIYDLVNLLRTLASPTDAVALLGVLRSPMFGLLDETIFWLAQHPEGLAGGLFDVAAEVAPTGAAEGGPLAAEIPAQQRAQVVFAAKTLTDLRAIKDRVAIAELIHEALARTGYDAMLVAEFLGERKLANLYKLVDQARSFDESGIMTLADFITQLSQFVARQPDEPMAATSAEAINAVRLMSIHQSKGLEFPLVVVADSDRRMRARSENVAFTPRLGPMVKTSAVSGFDLYRGAERDEDLAEGIRLLYVAATRAADYLIVSAGCTEAGVAQGPWTKLIHERFDPLSGLPRIVCAGGSPGDHVVRVTTSAPPLSEKSSGTPRRADLQAIVEKARALAARGGGQIPSWLASIAVDRGARRQFSFSRLKGTMHAEPPRVAVVSGDVDEVAQESTIDPRGLGTLVHAVLAELDPRRPADVRGLLDRHAWRHLANHAECSDGSSLLNEPQELIERLLKSPRWAAMAGATEFYTELEFLLPWPPGDPRPDGPFLQGFIDCLYRDASGGLHLVDYKTNRVTTAQIPALAAEYEMQMLVYALAVERILGEPPVELALHFLRIGEEYRFLWDDAARRRVVTLVDEQLAAAIAADSSM